MTETFNSNLNIHSKTIIITVPVVELILHVSPHDSINMVHQGNIKYVCFGYIVLNTKLYSNIIK